MTEIEVPDSPQGGAGAVEEEAPYRNLMVPLVVVPALIVMVFVLIWIFFSAILGDPPTAKDNIEDLLHGAANEREQASMGLVLKILAEQKSENGESTEWLTELLPGIRSVYEEYSDFDEPDEVSIPLALTILLAQAGDSQGVSQLADMTRLGPDLDPDGKYRMYAGFALGKFGEGLAAPDQVTAVRALVDMLEQEEDLGLRVIAAAGLQNLPSPETLEALEGALGALPLELRASAALSLAELGNASGVAVLREMLDPSSYSEERERSASKWERPEQVSDSRGKALLALAELGQAPPTPELERIAEEDPDPHLRETALRLLGDGD